MDYRHLHRWDLTPTEAVALQKELRGQVRVEPLSRPTHLIAGGDVSFNKYSDVIYAGIVVLKLPGLEVVRWATAVPRTTFPYIPGPFSFRETPALREVWRRLDPAPAAVMLDAQGYAHPRRFGYVSHFGLITGVPAL